MKTRFYAVIDLLDFGFAQAFASSPVLSHAQLIELRKAGYVAIDCDYGLFNYSVMIEEQYADISPEILLDTGDIFMELIENDMETLVYYIDEGS